MRLRIWEDLGVAGCLGAENHRGLQSGAGGPGSGGKVGNLDRVEVSWRALACLDLYSLQKT